MAEELELRRDDEMLEPIPVIGPGQTLRTIDDDITGIVLTRKWKIGWILGFLISFGLLQILAFAVTCLFAKGTGIWGINIPNAWGFAIINFVWWIGIGHAGTLISAILLLLKQDWRNSINRFAEAMTLFAVACAGMYPILHLGRPWLAYWLAPYPNTYNVWPQFRSPLIWDFFAVSTYGTVSLLFWYVGLIPDFASLRDRAGNKWFARLYALLSMGWRGSARHWQRYEMAYLLLAGMSTPLVLSVHSIVSFDFAVGIVPGWHSTIFPPYFVAGAVYAGFAMVLTIAIPFRKFYNLEGMITMKHIEMMCKVMLATGLIVGYGYAMEVFFGWYSANPNEQYMTWNRMFGPYWWSYWGLILTNILIPQVLWFHRFRMNKPVVFFVCLTISVGMWLERFVIIITSLHREFMPSKWGMYYPTIWDWATYAGTLGLFFTLLFLFIRFLPAINAFEMKHLLVHKKHEEHGHGAHGDKTAPSYGD
jgi:molybdopterin-containing oxidoreductase family membrane subunit